MCDGVRKVCNILDALNNFTCVVIPILIFIILQFNYFIQSDREIKELLAI